MEVLTVSLEEAQRAVSGGWAGGPGGSVWVGGGNCGLRGLTEGEGTIFGWVGVVNFCSAVWSPIRTVSIQEARAAPLVLDEEGPHGRSAAVRLIPNVNVNRSA